MKIVNRNHAGEKTNIDSGLLSMLVQAGFGLAWASRHHSGQIWKEFYSLGNSWGQKRFNKMFCL